MNPHWVFRADAGAEIGVGHAMRSIALACEAQAMGYQCSFLSIDLPLAVRWEAEQAGILVVDLHCDRGSHQDASAVLQEDPDVVSVDGYWCSNKYLSSLLGDCRAVLLVDDLGRDTAPVDVIINQNPWARASLYPHTDAKLLLGLDYALLRPATRTLIGTAGNRRERSGVVVSMGGSDVGSATLAVTESLVAEAVGPVRVCSGMLGTELMDTVVRRWGESGTELIESGQLAFALSQASLAIIGAGSTIWEAAAMGTPSLALVVASNQAPVLSSDVVRQFSRSVDIRGGLRSDDIAATAAELLADPAVLQQMSLAGRHHVDGDGARRALETLAARGDLPPLEGVTRGSV